MLRNIRLKFKFCITQNKTKLQFCSKLLSCLITKRVIFIFIILFLVSYVVKNGDFKIGFDLDKIDKFFDRKISSSQAFSSPLLPPQSSKQNKIEHQDQVFLVNTSNCKIPEFRSWSDAAQTLLYKKCTRYFWKNPNCQEHLHSWTYVKESHLHVNLTAVKESGYSWNSMRCCYKVINRVEQTLDDYNMMADRKVNYSTACFPITQQRQPISAEFIRVFCMSTSVPLLNDIVSREFFPIPQIDNATAKKILEWEAFKKSNPNDLPPPNVLIIGIDTMSRLNAYRTLNETLNLLQTLGAIEMKGYTKVGETTFPNTVAFMSGYNLYEIQRFCYRSVAVAQDRCPYLFKPFNQVGYLTAEIDDAPFGTSFNFLKAGFVKKPADFYIRPLMLAAMKHVPRENNWYLRCLGKKNIEQVMLDYLTDILKRVGPNSPVFAHVWLTVLAHECSAAAKYGDPIFKSFLERVDKENTIIFFMGDHGEVYGEFRETVQGWYEDKLPTMWVYLPERLKKLYPNWVESLQINSERLTSHFDLYKTLVHILQTFDKEKKAEETYSRLSKQTGQSLFEPVPEARSCSDAGVPEGYCACTEPKTMDVNNPNVIQAANIALKYIMDMLPGECETPTMGEILQAKYFVTPKGYKVYIIRFMTEPGQFMFEGTVKEEVEESGENGSIKKLVVANDVLRMNKIIRKVDCITIPLLERYCYCK